MALFLYGTYFGWCTYNNDEIFNYTPGMDITTLQVPRSTEADLYDYVISECQEAAKMLTKDTNKTPHALITG